MIMADAIRGFGPGRAEYLHGLLSDGRCTGAEALAVATVIRVVHPDEFIHYRRNARVGMLTH
jgi:hypothetical protein